MTKPPDVEAAKPNEDLRAMHSALIALVDRLDHAIDDPATSEKVTALIEQIEAVSARVTAVGRKLFAQESAAISQAAANFAARMLAIERSLADLRCLDTLVADMTGVLGLVDDALATAPMAV